MCGKISVIVPVYNVEEYLKRCVDSILCQTFSDLEIILVDDGSPDNCGAICDEYAKKDERVKVIHKQNGGLSSARNAGLEIASGEYIAFVDSDDWIHPQMCEITYEAITYADADFINFCYQIKTDNSEEILGYTNKDDIIKTTEVYSKDEVLNNFFNKYHAKLWMTVWSKLYKKHIFDDLRFEEGRIHEDELIMLPTIEKASQIAYLDISLYYYYFSESGIMHSKFGVKNLDKLYAFRKCYKFFEKGTEQYKIGQQKYYLYYLKVLLLTKKYSKSVREAFSQYIVLYFKDFFEILRNDKICTMLKVVLFMGLFFYKLPMKLCKKYFEETYSWVEDKIKQKS